MTRSERWLTRSVLAWTLYDLASSTFAALVPTFFGLYFVTTVASDLPGAQARWGAIASLALVIAGGLSPFVGAWADRRGRWLVLLTGTTALCIVATVSMPAAGRGDLFGAAVLFIAAQVGYTLATAIYDSLLIRVAHPTHVGRVSAFGWMVGFAGGIIALLAAVGVMHWTAADAQAARLKDAFLVAGLLYATFAVPGLLALRRLASTPADNPTPAATVREAYASVMNTLRHWRRHRELFRFLLAYYLINDVLVTILFFIAIIFRARFGLSIEGLLWLALLYHVLASPATLAFGHVADRWGQRSAIYVMMAILSAAIVLLAFGPGKFTPIAVVVLLGLVYGSLQAVCRSLLALLVPSAKAGEFFGFNAIAGRLSAALGPLMFGAAAAVSGSETAALLLLLAFLLAGAVVLSSLRIPSPQFAVTAAARTHDL